MYALCLSVSLMLSFHALQERRKQAINNAQKDFEKEQAAAMLRTERLMRSTMPDIVANHVANIPNGGANGDGTPDRSENSTPHSTRSRWVDG